MSKPDVRRWERHCHQHRSGHLAGVVTHNAAESPAGRTVAELGERDGDRPMRQVIQVLCHMARPPANAGPSRYRESPAGYDHDPFTRRQRKDHRRIAEAVERAMAEHFPTCQTRQDL